MSLSADQIRASLRPKSQLDASDQLISPESLPAARPSGPHIPSQDSGESSTPPPATDEPRPAAPNQPNRLMWRAERATRTRSNTALPAVLPHAFEAEQGVIGSMLISFSDQGRIAIEKARNLLSPESFHDPRHQILYRALIELSIEETKIDIITLGEYLRSKNLEYAAGGAAYYTSLFIAIPSTANVDYYIESVKRSEILRQIISLSLENARQANEPDAEVADILQVAHQRLQLVESLSTRAGRLPNLSDVAVMLNGQKPPRPAELIKGVLHQGSKLIVGGTSKGRKTFSLIDLAISVSTGTQWWGFETVQGPVCYINFEIQESFFCERTEDICRVKKISLSTEMFMGWNLRGHGEGIENLAEEIVAKLLSRHFVLVIFDPIYKALGDRDENKAGDVASLCNQLERVAVKTGAAIAFGAHYSKGNQAMKESIDRIGGSGVFARDPDSILTMTTHEETDCFTVDATLRNFPPIDPFVLKWDWPLFIRTNLDPENLKQPRTRQSDTGLYTAAYSKDMLLDRLSVIEGVRPSKLLKEVSELNGISRAQFYRLAKILKDERRLVETDGLWFRSSPNST